MSRWSVMSPWRHSMVMPFGDFQSAIVILSTIRSISRFEPRPNESPHIRRPRRYYRILVTCLASRNRGACRSRRERSRRLRVTTARSRSSMLETWTDGGCRMDERTRVFDEQRPRLLGLAYRMLCVKADAEDVLQDAYLRWRSVEISEIESPQAWLTTVVTRLSIDRLRRARIEREAYVGPWLPEPLSDPDVHSPETALELEGDLSIAFLVLLETLSPNERAAFLLHDVFDEDYSDVAAMLGKSEAACRQMVHRARERVTAKRRRF